MQENIKICINQKIALVGENTGKPIDDIHSSPNPYQMYYHDIDWGIWYICRDCYNKKIKQGWICTPIKINKIL